MADSLAARRLVGWTVTGRHGLLGHVVDAEHGHVTDDAHLLVRGGTTDVLYYHVPLSLVATEEALRQSIGIDADVADFTAHLRPDRSVDLFYVPHDVAAPSSAQPEEESVAHQGEDVRGREVIADDGTSVGEVQDIIVDDDYDDRRFLVVGTRGFLGLGRHEFLVPVDAIQWIEEERVHVGESALRMSGGPPYHPVLVLDHDYFAEVCAYYGVDPRAGRHDQTSRRGT